MTSIRNYALLAALVGGIGATAVAVAQGPAAGPGYGPGGCAYGAAMMQGKGPGMMQDGGPGMGPGMMKGGARGASAEQRAEFHQQRLAAMKQTLNITAEQEPAWNAFVAKADAHQPGSMGPPPAAAGPDGFGAHIAFMKERLASMEQMQGAYKQLYAVLTPAQRERLGNSFGPRWIEPGN